MDPVSIIIIHWLEIIDFGHNFRAKRLNLHAFHKWSKANFMDSLGMITQSQAVSKKILLPHFYKI